MEVSRIEAAPTKIIDWRRLTAKEIIKYNNDGVEVPPQYLKWAIDFRQDLEKNDKDDITYEMAEKQKIEENKEKNNIDTNTAKENEEAEVTVSPDGIAEESNPANDVNNKTPAEKKREDMQNDGKSLIKQGITFILETRKINREDIATGMTIQNAEKKATQEIEELEGEMSTLISRAESIKNDIKAEYENINTEGKNNKMTFAKINRLQQKLQTYGQVGQSRLASSEGDFTVYETIINSKNGIIDQAMDYGAVTTDIGNELLSKTSAPYVSAYGILGRNAVAEGTFASKSAERNTEIKNEANSVNNKNKMHVYELEARVENKTGVEGYSLTADGEQAIEDKEKIKTQTAAATETDKAASASLDQVLLAKLRRGQTTEA